MRHDQLLAAATAAWTVAAWPAGGPLALRDVLCILTTFRLKALSSQRTKLSRRSPCGVWPGGALREVLRSGENHLCKGQSSPSTGLDRTRPPDPGTALTAATDVAFSVVSFAEIGVNVAIGKLTIPDDFYARVLASGMRILGLSAEHGLALGRLPLLHRDPFDRLLVAQAQMDGFTLVTGDAEISAYDVPVLDPLT